MLSAFSVGHLVHSQRTLYVLAGLTNRSKVEYFA